MYIDLLNNLAIVSALMFVGGRLFRNRSYGLRGKPVKVKIAIGILCGIMGTLLMLSTISVTNSVIVDLRHLSLFVAAFFGGVVAAVVTAVILAIIRIAWFGLSEASIAAASALLVMSFFFGWLSNLHTSKLVKYGAMHATFIAVSSGIIYYFVGEPGSAYEILWHYWIVSTVGGFFAYYVAEYIHQSNENYRSAIYFKFMAENASDMISTHELNGTFKYASPSCEHLLGYEPDELIGLHPYDYYHSDDLDRIRHMHRQSEGPGSQYAIQYRFRRKDGSYVWLETTVKRMMGNDRKEEEIICASRDVTERKRIEEELIEANAKLQRLSMLDGLTEVANRRSFDEAMEREWRQAQREGKPLSLLLFDIDCFKSYNDTYGHQLGDDCIIKVARQVQSVLRRPKDFLARYGGEEFAILLPDTDAEGAMEVAEAVRGSVESLGIPHTVSSVAPVVTVSVGISTLHPGSGDDAGMLIKASDQALYRAKAEGRNRTRFGL